MNEISKTKILIFLTLLPARFDSGEGLLFAYSREGFVDCSPWEGSYEVIRDVKVCRDFAESNGYKFGTETESGYPGGCYLNDKKIYFNRHNPGTGEINSMPICSKRIPNEETEKLLESKLDKLMEENTSLRQQLQNLSSIVESIDIKQNDILSGQKENREGLGSLLKGWKRKGWKLN